MRKVIVQTIAMQLQSFTELYQELREASLGWDIAGHFAKRLGNVYIAEYFI